MNIKEAEMILGGKYDIDRIDMDKYNYNAYIILRHKRTFNKRCIDLDDKDTQFMVRQLALHTVNPDSV